MQKHSETSSEIIDSGQKYGIYEFEGYQLDPVQYQLRLRSDGQPVHLTGRAFDALCLLVQRHGELVDKATLMQRLWPHVVVEENNLVQTIYALRHALGEKPGENRFIATVQGRGYRFVADVREVPRVSASTAEGANEPTPELLAEAAPALLSSRWAVAALVLTLAGGAWWWAESRKHTDGFTAQQGAPVAATVQTSVAVLPFANLSGDPSNDYLGDGLAADLITTLAAVPGLKVPARTSSFAYRGRNTDMRQIGKDLGVGAILEGSVQVAGDRIRITAQLVNVEDGFGLWSQVYDRQITDLFKLQDELAMAIGRALKLQLGGSPASIVQTRWTQNLESYRLTLQGIALSEGPVAEKGWSQAIELFQQALARDPNNARAYSGLAFAHLRAIAPGGESAAAHFPAAEQAALKAQQLEPNSAKTENVLGQVRYYDMRWVESKQHLQRSIELDPTDALIKFEHAWLQLRVGQTHTAVQQMREAYALAPANLTVVYLTTAVHMVAGLDAEALRYADLAIALGAKPGSQIIRFAKAMAARRAGRYNEWAKYVDEDYAPRPGTTPDPRAAPAVALNHLIYAAVADPSQHAAAVAALASVYPRGDKPLSGQLAALCKFNAEAFVALGDIDAAYTLANRCLQPQIHEPFQLIPSLWTAEIRAFRADPRLQAYVARVGLMPYYEKYGPPDNCDLISRKLTCH